MAARSNEFQTILATFLDELLRIEHASHIAERMTTRMQQETKDSIQEYRSEHGEGTNVLGSSNLLSIALLDSPPGHHSRHSEIEAHDEEFVALLGDLGGRLQGECVVRLYENTERFVGNIAGKFFWLKRNEFRSRNEKRFRRAQKDEKHVGTEDYYVRYAREQCRHNSSEVVAELCRFLPAFQQIQETNWFQPGLLKHYRGIAFCRHKITHCGGRMDAKELHSLSPDVADWIERSVHPDSLTGDSTVLPDSHFVKQAVEIIAALAYALFREMSKACSMQVAQPVRYGNVFGPKS